MPQMKETEQQRAWPQATLVETQLDSICLILGQMKTKLEKAQMLEHMTESERAELQAALARAEARMTELSSVIRGDA